MAPEGWCVSLSLETLFIVCLPVFECVLCHSLSLDPLLIGLFLSACVKIEKRSCECGYFFVVASCDFYIDHRGGLGLNTHMVNRLLHLTKVPFQVLQDSVGNCSTLSDSFSH